jgi:branched-chain amino acid transport system substrate-binding protein
MIDKSNIPLIANCGHPTITREFKNIYRNFPSTGVEVKRMASFISSTLKLRTIWLLYIDDAFGKGAEQIAEQVFPNHGLVLLGSDPYAKSTSDTKPIVLKALKSKADAIYVYGYGIATAEVVNRLRQLGFKGVLLGSLNFAQPPLTTVSNKAIEGSYYTIPSFEHVGMTASKEFWDGFQSRFKQNPPWNAAVEYDAIMLIAEAVKLNIQQGGSILENLGRIGNYSGVAGKYLYENTKDWELSMSVAQITENGIKYFD